MVEGTLGGERKRVCPWSEIAGFDRKGDGREKVFSRLSERPVATASFYGSSRTSSSKNYPSRTDLKSVTLELSKISALAFWFLSSNDEEHDDSLLSPSPLFFRGGWLVYCIPVSALLLSFGRGGCDVLVRRKKKIALSPKRLHTRASDGIRLSYIPTAIFLDVILFCC